MLAVDRVSWLIQLTTEGLVTDPKRRKVAPHATPASVEEDAQDRNAGAQGPQPRPPYPDPVDDALDDSFPASDPPPWWGR